MKKITFILTLLLLFPVLSNAQEHKPITIELTAEQYKQIKGIYDKAAWEAKKNKDWAFFSKYAEANKKITKAPKAVFIGDSITECWYREHAVFFDENNYVCRGISGQTTAEILVRMQADVIMLKPKYAVINMGINDIASNNGKITKENMLLNVKSMIELCRANKIKPIMTTTLPSNNVWRTDPVTGEVYTPAKDIEEFNRMLADYAKKNHVTLVNYYSKMEVNGGLTKDMAKDGTHPTLKGYAVMEEIIVKYLK